MKINYELIADALHSKQCKHPHSKNGIRCCYNESTWDDPCFARKRYLKKAKEMTGDEIDWAMKNMNIELDDYKLVE